MIKRLTETEIKQISDDLTKVTNSGGNADKTAIIKDKVLLSSFRDKMLVQKPKILNKNLKQKGLQHLMTSSNSNWKINIDQTNIWNNLPREGLNKHQAINENSLNVRANIRNKNDHHTSIHSNTSDSSKILKYNKSLM